MSKNLSGMKATPGNIVMALSVWIDNFNSHKDAGLQIWGRCGKVMEEAGEVAQTLIGLLGQNPRKGFTHSKADTVEELLDVAITALGAVEHLTGNTGTAFDLLEDKIMRVGNRANLIGEDGCLK